MTSVYRLTSLLITYREYLWYLCTFFIQICDLRSLFVCIFINVPGFCFPIGACFPCEYVHECVWMLGCATVPLAPYNMPSSVGMWSPLGYVILQWPTPLHGCGNQLKGEMLSLLCSFFFMNLFFISWLSSLDVHTVRGVNSCSWNATISHNLPQVLCRWAPLMSLYPGKNHAHTFPENILETWQQHIMLPLGYVIIIM